ncbi:SirB2 family protein [Roseinatronobacter alkalisoli]|uniref:SirB2 family protein n=1 Tax=Roseinatronobacter alkalisoli TaxID=3028235 RepID=A0ABT5TH29_9RHOB|nr:SirB2 family protein [Roseinatronobacter sp. HJB301]MDD7973472.1 SirB2 family protein [Roseinatronobacter sp. HJB301]
MYLALKNIHLTFVVLSLLAFFIRGIWLFMNSSMLSKKWVKILPHVISTILLVSGIVLAVHLSMSPGSQPWLMAKIIGLIAYIGLGVAAFKVPNPNARKLLWISALIVFAYIVSAAISKNPLGFLI